MFDTTPRPVETGPLDAADLGGLVALLAALDTTVGDVELVDRIGALERVKAAAAAAQVRMTAAFAASQRRAQQAAGVPAKRLGEGIAAQVALARKESPARAARYVGWAMVLVGELPRTIATLQRGDTTEWRAMLVARETIWLSRADRATVDDALADRLPALGDNQVECEAKKLAYLCDPEGFVARSRAAASGRRVTLRPAPDTMTRLTALLPAPQAVAAYAALIRAASAARAAGDPRGRGQVMADTLVERVTGQAAADEVPVNIDLVMTDQTLFGGGGDAQPGSGSAAGADDTREAESGTYSVLDEHEGDADEAGLSDDVDILNHADSGDHEDRPGFGDHAGLGDLPGFGDHGGRGDRAGGTRYNEPAHLIGYGPIPAGVARDLARAANARAWVRRLYVKPKTGELAAMDSRARSFPESIRHAVIIRDQLCRTPWCGAAIRHTDHARSVARGGETGFRNGQGLCEACNYAKESPGWSTEVGPEGTAGPVTVTTPTGHQYVSTPPELPGSRCERSAVDVSMPPGLPGLPCQESAAA